MKKMNNVFKNMKAEFKAAYNESKARYDAKFENTAAKAEELGYKAVKAVYTPAYGVGYVTDAIATTKVAKHIAAATENVKFSAKEGYEAGKEAHIASVAKKSQEVEVQITSNLAQSINEYTESAAMKRAAQELAARWQKDFEEMAKNFCQKEDEEVFVNEDEENAIYYGDGVWNGSTSF